MLLKYFYLGIFAGTCVVAAILGDETAPAAAAAAAPVATIPPVPYYGMCVCHASFTDAFCGCY